METAWDDLWHAELVSIWKWVDHDHETTCVVSTKAVLCHDIHTHSNVFNGPNLWEEHIPETLDAMDSDPAICMSKHKLRFIRLLVNVLLLSMVVLSSVTLIYRRERYRRVLLPIRIEGLTCCTVRDDLHLSVVILFICGPSVYQIEQIRSFSSQANVIAQQKCHSIDFFFQSTQENIRISDTKAEVVMVNCVITWEYVCIFTWSVVLPHEHLLRFSYTQECTKLTHL